MEPWPVVRVYGIPNTYSWCVCRHNRSHHSSSLAVLYVAAINYNIRNLAEDRGKCFKYPDRHALVGAFILLTLSPCLLLSKVQRAALMGGPRKEGALRRTLSNMVSNSARPVTRIGNFIPTDGNNTAPQSALPQEKAIFIGPLVAKPLCPFQLSWNFIIRWHLKTFGIPHVGRYMFATGELYMSENE